jgi:hypothetical protein
MQAFLGSHPNISDVEAHVEGFFQAAWTRMSRVYGWSSEKSPNCTTKTVYNWLLQDREKFQLLKDSKVVTSVTFAAEAASNARHQRDMAHDMARSADASVAGGPSPDVVVDLAPAICVPQRALLYPAGAPRPYPPLRKGASRKLDDDFFDTYLEENAPKPGARPCWSCPLCLTSRHFHILQNLSRHLRTVHDDVTEERRDLVMSQCDIARLVWCTNRGGASHWEALLQ